jgi:hypothetical protein
LQRVYRGLFKVLGPAQQGPPPYATEAELAEYRASMTPVEGRGEPEAPQGYRFSHYTDGRGVVHRAVIRVEDEAN